MPPRNKRGKDCLKKAQLHSEKTSELKSSAEYWKILYEETILKIEVIKKENIQLSHDVVEKDTKIEIIISEHDDTKKRIFISEKQCNILRLKVDQIEDEMKDIKINQMNSKKPKLQYTEMNGDEPGPSEEKILQAFSTLQNSESQDNRMLGWLNDAIYWAGGENPKTFMIYSFTHAHKYTDFQSAFSTMQTWSLKIQHNLSDGFMKNFKSTEKEVLGFDVLASRGSVLEFSKTHDVSHLYNIDSEIVIKNKNELKVPRIMIKKVEPLLKMHLERLDDAGRVDYDNPDDPVNVNLYGDKGRDEVKCSISIADGPNPNCVYSLSMITLYIGSDTYQELKARLPHMFKDINQLKFIKFNGKRRRVVFHVLADMKFVSATVGHSGQSSNHPCYKCYIKICLRGKDKSTLLTFDFKQVAILRTLKSMRKDAKTGAFGMILGSSPLLNINVENLAPPEVHIILRIFKKYIYDSLLAECNLKDHTDINEERLADQKRNLEKMRNEELTALENLKIRENELKDAEKMYDALVDYRKIRKPCSSVYCIGNKVVPKSSEMISCCDCKKLFHSQCLLLLSEEEVREKRLNYSCILCRKITLQMLVTESFMKKKSLELIYDQKFDAYNKTVAEREKLEDILIKMKGPTRQELEKILRDIGCDQRAFFQEMVGNQVRKILRPPNIERIMNILKGTPKYDSLRQVMILLGRIMSYGGTKTYSEAEIKEFEELLDLFVDALRECHPNEAVIPSLHMLYSHVPDHMRIHGSWGRSSEQVGENLHSHYNRIDKNYSHVPNVVDRAKLVLRRMNEWNYMYDTGELDKCSSFDF